MKKSASLILVGLGLAAGLVIASRSQPKEQPSNPASASPGTNAVPKLDLPKNVDQNDFMEKANAFHAVMKNVERDLLKTLQPATNN